MNKKTARWKHLVFIFFVAFSYFVTMPIQQPVLASSITYDFGFEDTVAGSGITEGLPVGSDNIFTSSAASGTWCVTASNMRTGTRCWYDGLASGSSGYYYSYYSTSQYLTNFTQYIRSNDIVQYWYFINSSTSDVIINLRYESSTHRWSYQDELAAYHIIDNAITHDVYYYWTWNIDNALGDVTYKVGTVQLVGTAKNPTAISNGERIDKIQVYNTGTGHAAYWDDWTWILSDSYTGESTEDINDCSEPYIDDSWVGTGFGYDGAQCFWDNHLHFIGESAINGTFSGFELLVDFSQWYGIDNNLSNYTLYYNAWCLNEPCGFVNHPNGIVLQWDLTPYDFSTDGEERAVWTVHHVDYGQTGLSWCLPTKTANAGVWVGFADWERVYNEDEWSNVGLYGTRYDEYLCYKIYLSDIEEPEPPFDYENDIVVIGDGVNQSDGVQYVYTGNTVWFDTTVNDTDLGYTLHVYNNTGVEFGEDGGFPYSVELYHTVVGFVPLVQGYYNVTLKSEGVYVLHENFYVKSDWVTKTYDIWSIPPSTYQDEDYGVYVYINDGADYDYYSVAMFLGSNLVSFYDKASYTTIVGTLDGYNWSFMYYPVIMNQPVHFWRIFGSDDMNNWYPLGSAHNHIIDSYDPDGYGYITITDTTPLVGQSVHIGGYHSRSFNCWIFVNGQKRWDVSSNNVIDITTSFSSEGSYVLTLRDYVNGAYQILGDPITVIVSEDDGGGGGGGGDNDEISLFKTVAGLAIVLGFGIVPIALFKNNQFAMRNGAAIVSVFAIFGLGIVVYYGLLEIWVAYMIGLLCAAFIGLGIYSKVSKGG